MLLILINLAVAIEHGCTHKGLTLSVLVSIKEPITERTQVSIKGSAHMR